MAPLIRKTTASIVFGVAIVCVTLIGISSTDMQHTWHNQLTTRCGDVIISLFWIDRIQRTVRNPCKTTSSSLQCRYEINSSVDLQRNGAGLFDSRRYEGCGWSQDPHSIHCMSNDPLRPVQKHYRRSIMSSIPHRFFCDCDQFSAASDWLFWLHPLNSWS
jgi:hypothetical protein